MIKGFNKAHRQDELLWENYSRKYSSVRNRPCVFLSHQHKDKAKCRVIAEYLSNAEIDYYLDEEDPKLQQAVFQNDAQRITDSIKEGIQKSSHMLCVVSKNTLTSQWVPFEIGYANAAIFENKSIPSSIKLSILTLKTAAEEDLPAYMETANITRGIRSLNSFVSSILNRLEHQIINEDLIKSHNFSSHPLGDILAWDK